MPNDGSLTVLIVDDHPAVRSGIASLIDAEQPRLRTVGAVGTGEEALARTRDQQPDVVVLDVNLAGRNGLALIPALRGAAPCHVVVLTSLSDPRIAQHAQRLGACSCVHKTAPAGELLASILQAHPSTRSTATPLPSTNVGGDSSHSPGTNHL